MNGATGVGLVEIYGLDNTVDSTLANISTRGSVQTGDDVMIGGLILVGGTGPRKIIVRAIGPSLPVAGKLADPTLDLVDQNGVVLRSNDNWRSTQEGEIVASTVPPTNDLEAAIVATVPAAPHTAIVRGVNGFTGVALVEVFPLQLNACPGAQDGRRRGGRTFSRASTGSFGRLDFKTVNCLLTGSSQPKNFS